MNAVFNSEEPSLKSTVETLINQHGLMRVLGTLLTRALRRPRAKPRTIMASDLSPHLRRDIGL